MERFEGAKQLDNPAVLNLRRLRHALLPGISCYGSAHGLAPFYAALVAGPLVPLALLAQAQVRASSGHESSGAPVRYGLGFQLGSCDEVSQRLGEVSPISPTALAHCPRPSALAHPAPPSLLHPW